MHGSTTGEVTDEAPMGTNDLVDMAAAVQEQHVVGDLGIRRRRREVDGPPRHALHGHLDAAAETRRLVGGRPQCQSAHVLLHDRSGR